MESFLQMMGIFIFTLFFRISYCDFNRIVNHLALILSGIPIGFVAQMCFAGLDNYTYLAISDVCFDRIFDGNGRSFAALG